MDEAQQDKPWNDNFADVGRGISLCYEPFGEPANPPLLLIMGLGTQMIGWPNIFCQQLAAEGFYVIRFDNRDCGQSTSVKGAPPTTMQILTRSKQAAQYTLADMADDSVGLLDALGIGAAHIVGASMGGMIAQTIAARHSKRVRSLTSIMSNTGSLLSGQPRLRTYPLFLQRAPRSREGYIAYVENIFATIGSKKIITPQDKEDIHEIAVASYERGPNSSGTFRQLAAIIASGNRTAELHQITASTLVIHGTADILVPFSGGKATAQAIAGSNLLPIKDMGHDLPRARWEKMVNAITGLARRIDLIKHPDLRL